MRAIFLAMAQYNGESLKLASVKPMAFEPDLSVVPAREEGRDTLRRLSQLHLGFPISLNAEMSSTPWISRSSEIELQRLEH